MRQAPTSASPSCPKSALWCGQRRHRNFRERGCTPGNGLLPNQCMPCDGGLLVIASASLNSDNRRRASAYTSFPVQAPLEGPNVPPATDRVKTS
jgi:hypothetical protein